MFLDLIGGGTSDEESEIQMNIERLGLQGIVRLKGRRPYGASLILELAEYDAILFTPTETDTPRMIFDGYAAGLPLIGNDMEYLREREREDRAAIVAPSGDIKAGAALLQHLDCDRRKLAALSRQARVAGIGNSADNWGLKRTEWTRQAVDRFMGTQQPR